MATIDGTRFAVLLGTMATIDGRTIISRFLTTPQNAISRLLLSADDRSLQGGMPLSHEVEQANTQWGYCGMIDVIR